MLFNIPRMISLRKCFPFHSSKAGLVESDAFDKVLLGPGSSSLASEAVVHRSSCSSGGRTF